MCDSYCFSTATVVLRMHLNYVMRTLHVLLCSVIYDGGKKGCMVDIVVFLLSGLESLMLFLSSTIYSASVDTYPCFYCHCFLIQFWELHIEDQ